MALILDIYVQPLSKKNGFLLDKAQRLKCYLRSVPEKGRANRELIEKLAKALDISSSAIQILSGHIARKKRVAIDTDLSYEQFLIAIGISVQRRIF